MGMSRREFVKAGALTGGGLAAAAAVVVKDRVAPPPADPTGPDTAVNLPVLENVAARSDEDVLLRMQRDLKRAMSKPVEQRQWVMVIDQRKCIGCHACTIGCVAENKLPPGVVYRPVVTEERGEFPHIVTVHGR